MKKKDAIELMYEDGCKLGDLSEDFYVFLSIKYSIFIYGRSWSRCSKVFRKINRKK